MPFHSNIQTTNVAGTHTVHTAAGDELNFFQVTNTSANLVVIELLKNDKKTLGRHTLSPYGQNKQTLLIKNIPMVLGQTLKMITTTADPLDWEVGGHA